MLKPNNHERDGTRMAWWEPLNHEGRALRNDIDILDPLVVSAMWRQGEYGIYETGIGPSPDTESAGGLKLDSQTCRTRNNLSAMYHYVVDNVLLYYSK